MWVIRWRWIILSLAALLSIAAALGLKHIPLDLSLETNWVANSEKKRFLEEFKAEFSDYVDFITIILVADDVLDPVFLATSERLANALAQISGVKRVYTFATYPHTYNADGTLTTASVAERVVKDPRFRDGTAAEILLGSEVFRPRFVSPELDAAATYIQLERGIGNDRAKSKPVVIAIRNLLRQHIPPQWTVHLVGVAITQTVYAEMISGDQVRLLPVALLVILVLLYLVYRRVWAVYIPLIAAATTILLTFGVLALWGATVTLVQTAIPVMLLVITSATVVYIFNRYLEECTRWPEHRTALAATVRGLCTPLSLAGLTTVIGFFSLNTARVASVPGFGTNSAIGAVVAATVTLCVVPALLSFHRPPTAAELQRYHEGVLYSLLHRVANFGERHEKAVVGAFMLTTLLSLAIALRIDTSSYLNREVPYGHPLRVASRYIDTYLAGASGLDVSLRASDGTKLLTPERLRAIKRVKELLEQKPEVMQVRSVVDFLEEFRQQFYGGDRQERDLPDTVEELEQYLLAITSSDVQAAELGDMVNAAGTWVRVRVQTGDLGSKEYAALRQRVVDIFQEELGEAVDWQITGSLDMSKEASQMFVRDMLVSFTTGFVLISLTLMARFRSVRLGLLSMVPNVLPMLVTFAVMALLGIRLQIGTLVVFSISLGIAVDDTIYFLSRCAKEVSEGASYAEATRRTLLSDGRAMIITSLVLTLGFAVVMISQFAALRFFGLLNGTVFLTSIVAELMLTPALVRALRPF